MAIVPDIRLEQVTQRFGENVVGVDDVSLAIEPGLVASTIFVVALRLMLVNVLVQHRRTKGTA